MNHDDYDDYLSEYADGPRLLADIGGTNARFALERAPGRIADVATLACDGHPRFVDAVRAYLRRHPQAGVRHAVVAIANPVEGDFIRMTNHHWQFSIAQARADLGLDTLLLVNDFAALAMSVPELAAAELVQVGGGAAREDGVIGVLGAGTGLGVAGLVPAAAVSGASGASGGWTVLASEGGHVAFSPADEREQRILSFCWQRYPHVSAERLISGPGLTLIHEALSAIRSAGDGALSPALVVERGLAGDAMCRETLEVFCGMLGTMAANLAVTLTARGGIYIGGGVVPRLGGWFAASPFRARFEHKGRFSSFTAQIPCFVIHAPTPALPGAARMLAQHLERRNQAALQIGSVASFERRTGALTP
jgi:glucokinase